MAQPIPKGLHTLTPHLNVQNGQEAIEFYGKAFGAELKHKMDGPGGMLMHAEIMIGDSHLFLAQANPEWGNKSPQDLGGTPVILSLYVEDADAAAKRAIDAGCTEIMPVADQFWGDRYGQVQDPYGHVWAVCTHVEDVSDEEIQKRATKAFGD